MNAFCAVCPVRVGAGMQTKVLEYMSLGIPCVSSSIGLEGIDAIPGRDILVGDSPEIIAQHVLDLYTSQDLRFHVSRSARTLIEQKYTWESIYPEIVADAEELLTTGRRQPAGEAFGEKVGPLRRRPPTSRH
jgi:glycosyltransferase involved in cell wall biosynthesis